MRGDEPQSRLQGVDVAAGNGMAGLAAARRWCNVTSTDYVQPFWSAAGRELRPKAGPSRSRKRTRKISPSTTTVSTCLRTFGVMFTPNQDKAASELLRGAVRGERLVSPNWTPEGFIGQMFKTLGKYLPPPAGAQIAGAVCNALAA